MAAVTLGLVLAFPACRSNGDGGPKPVPSAAPGAVTAPRATLTPPFVNIEEPTSPPTPLPIPSGPTPTHWRVLLDLRAADTGPGSEVSDDEAEKILSRVYPEPERLRPGQECGDDSQFLPTIVGQASGSFTASKKKQTAYFINEGWCSAPGGGSPGAVAVFEGGKLVATVDEVAGYFLEKLVDLDQDGRHELLISWRSYRFGAGMAGTSLLSLAGGEETVIKDFGEVLVRECEDTGSLEPDGTEASVLYYVPARPGTMPTEYHVEGYTAPCDARGPSGFKLVSRDGQDVK